MALNTNFNEIAFIRNGIVEVKGTTATEPGYQLVSRAFTVQQKDDNKCVHRLATKVIGWKASQPIREGELVPGPAVALGTETYYLERAIAGPSSYVTISWAQVITIKA